MSIVFLILSSLPISYTAPVFLPPDWTHTIYSCQVAFYKDIVYKRRSIGRVGTPAEETEEDCVKRCLRRPGCNAVNYYPSECHYLAGGIEGSYVNRGIAETFVDDSKFDYIHGWIHAVIECTHEQTEPSGSGVQASSYPSFPPRNGEQTAKAHSWPWMVAVMVTGRDGMKKLCPGVVMNDEESDQWSKFVAVSRTCITEEGSHLRFMTGRELPDVTTQRVRLVIAGAHVVEQFVDGQQHSAASSISVLNDAFVRIKLDPDFMYSDTVRPIGFREGHETKVDGPCFSLRWAFNERRKKRRTHHFLMMMLVFSGSGHVLTQRHVLPEMSSSTSSAVVVCKHGDRWHLHQTAAGSSSLRQKRAVGLTKVQGNSGSQPGHRGPLLRHQITEA